MEHKEYNRIKKIDIKRWLLGGNSKVYALILVLFLAAVLLVFKTVTSMNKANNDIPAVESIEETSSDKKEVYIPHNQKYLISVNKSMNFIVIYTLDSNMEYTVVQDAFWCSVNSSVKTGDTSINDKSVWYQISNSAYGHYGDMLGNGAWIHSVPYYAQDAARLDTAAYNNLGKTAQIGSIYIEAQKAKWIYENCVNGTVVKIIEDTMQAIPDSLSQPETVAANASYDPSEKIETVEGAVTTPINYMRVVNNKVIKTGEKFDYMDGASAFDIYGKDISSYITVTGIVDSTKAGVYPLTYRIVDNFGTNLEYYREVTVIE